MTSYPRTCKAIPTQYAGARMRRARGAWTQVEFAERLGINVTSLARIERDERKVRHALLMLAERLGQPDSGA